MSGIIQVTMQQDALLNFWGFVDNTNFNHCGVDHMIQTLIFEMLTV